MKTVKRLIIAFCFVGLLAWNVQLTEAAGRFHDVSSDFWAAEEIGYLSDLKIINGYGNGQFGPQDSIRKRADAAIIVAQNYDNLNLKMSKIHLLRMYQKTIMPIEK